MKEAKNDLDLLIVGNSFSDRGHAQIFKTLFEFWKKYCGSLILRNKSNLLRFVVMGVVILVTLHFYLAQIMHTSYSSYTHTHTLTQTHTTHTHKHTIYTRI